MLTKEKLQNKYIKYNSEVTEEVFNKILDKLHSIGFIECNAETYPSFKTRGCLSIGGSQEEPSPDDQYRIWKAPSWSRKEIQVSDILGEDWNKSEDKEWWKSLKKGDYVVTIKEGSSNFRKNFIFKLRKDWEEDVNYIRVEKDCAGDHNGWLHSNFRLATPEEIELYKHAGKPVDVTTYKIPEETKSKEFVLPEKWCVALTKKNAKILGNWRRAGYCGILKEDNPYGYIHSNKGDWVHNKKTGYTEITFEQFKEHVLGEKGGDMKETTNKALLEEAKRKYPVGTKFYPAHISKHDDDWYFTVKSHKLEQPNEFPRNISFISDRPDNQGWVPNVYSNGKWAEIISSPKEKSIEKWSVGSYVVVIKGQFGCFSAGSFNDKKNPLIKGTVFTITSDNFSFNSVSVAEADYWIYKNNLKWFLTKEEAEAFAKTLIEPEKITPSTLQAGIVYHASYNTEEYIFDLSQRYICVPSSFWSISFKMHTYYKYREATKEEQEWFKACKKAGKFILKKDIAKSEQPKFEVGKWYKNIDSGYIGKLTAEITSDRFPSTEYIYRNKYYSNGSFFTINSIKNAVECPLEEIQQYLPDNHVDKLVKEKKNVKSNYVNVRTQEQWDFVTKKLGYKWETGRWDVYKQDSNINLHDQYYTNYCDDTKCCTFEQWLKDTGYTYPENKFNYKFKVGDKVKVIHSGSGCTHEEVNKKVEITERGDYDGDPGYKVSPAIGNTATGNFRGFIGEISFELITSKEETYKVGDWVYIIDPDDTYGCKLNKGDVLEVVRTRSKNPVILTTIAKEGKEIYATGVRKATPEEIAKAKQDEYYDPIKPELEWKVGAYVRYKGTKKYDGLWEEYFGKHGVVKGDVGVIQKTLNNSKWYFIKDNIRTDDAGILLKKDIELITKEEYERGLRRDTAPWKVPTLVDLPYTPKKSYKKTDKVEVQLIDVPRI